MKIGSVFDPEFKPYGTILEGYDCSELLGVLEKTPCPADNVIKITPKLFN